MPTRVEIATEEVRGAKASCLDLLARIEALCPRDANGNYPDMFRLMAIPMFYAVWERTFTLCHSISLRLLREEMMGHGALTPSQKAVFLQAKPFYAGFVARVRAAEAMDRKGRLKKGAFLALSEFIAQFEAWLAQDIDQVTPADELVMTFSNVNPEVARLNAAAIGLDDHPAFQSVELGRLDDLVGRRNDIGHGGLINPPGNREFLELLDYTRKLISDYSNAVEAWIFDKFGPAAPAAVAEGNA